MLPARGLPTYMLSLADLQQPAQQQPLSAQTAAGGFAGARREEDDHALHLPCVSSCDAVMRLMLFLRLFFHGSNHGGCHGEVIAE